MTLEEIERRDREHYDRIMRAHEQARASSPFGMLFERPTDTILGFCIAAVLVGGVLYARGVTDNRVAAATPMFEKGASVTVKLDNRKGVVLHTWCRGNPICLYTVRVSTPSGYSDLDMQEFELTR